MGRLDRTREIKPPSISKNLGGASAGDGRGSRSDRKAERKIGSVQRVNWEAVFRESQIEQTREEIMTSKPIAIDVFAGCGGLSLGLRRAGFDVQVAVEIDSTAATTYRANHPKVTLLESDICDVSADALLSNCSGKVDL